MRRILSDFHEMGGKATQLTGGGEPLLYPHKEKMFDDIIHYGFDYALVTNGTLLTEDLAKRIAPKMSWARISIDAGRSGTYSDIRGVDERLYDKAIHSISLLRKYAENPQFRLGVGFVMNNENYMEVYDACVIAKEAGADNVRISAVFHKDGMKHFKKLTIQIGSKLAEKAEELNDETFKVYNLFDERIDNLRVGKQDYKFCGTKELLCVIGGNCDVYTCCSLAFHKKGKIGNLKEQSFKELWDSERKKKMFERFDASKVCNYMCLYESRNRFINQLLNKNVSHINFI
jgi:MoaA/NifB/PqqE/SkfB family radical SAM enzyme